MVQIYNEIFQWKFKINAKKKMQKNFKMQFRAIKYADILKLLNNFF